MKVLYEDREVIVCFKEAGLPVQSAGFAVKDMESLLRTYLREQQDAKPGDRAKSSGKGKPADKTDSSVPFLGIIHRLDQPVQGILVFAKTRKAAADLSAQVTDGRMEKTYTALVQAVPGAAVYDSMDPSEETVLTDYLLKDPKTNTSRVVSKETRGAKKAVLAYRVAGRGENNRFPAGVILPDAGLPENAAEEIFLLKVRLQTGRHHQIRVQLAHAGMPILGDTKYGRKIPGGAEYGKGEGGIPEKLLRFPALCASALSFEHPVSRRRKRFELGSEEIIFR